MGIWSPNRWEWVLTQYATAECGLILVNINPAYRLHELEFVLNQAGIRAVIAPVLQGLGLRADAARPCVRRRLRSSTCVLLDSPEWETRRQRPRSPTVSPDRRLAEAGGSINIQYTSGTTGFPKGATLSHTNLLNNGFFVGELVHYTEADRVCLPVPFYHCFGMVMGNLACTSHGAAMIIPSATFDPAAALTAVQREKCTSLYGVPTMFIAELALQDFASYDLSTLRTGIMAGSPCPAEVMRQVIGRMHMEEVSICYGMTETSPVSTQTRTDDSLERRVGTVGRVGPHLEIKIVDSEGRTVPRGVNGEFCTRGYSVMLGYWQEPEKTAQVLDADGWMHTGDLAVMDAERLRADHRPHQGHGHPRRREPLSARDRGVPLHPSGHPRRPGRGRARSEVRRGAHGLDPDARRARSRSPPSRSGRSPPASSRATRSRATCTSSTSSR